MRYKSILEQKVKVEKEEQKKQEILKQAAGIESADLRVKKKGAKDYAISLCKAFLYLVFMTFVALGILTILNPVSRNIIHSIVKPLALAMGI